MKFETPATSKNASQETPFVDSLMSTKFDARSVKIWGLKDEPGKLVRERDVEEGEDIESLKRSFDESKELFGRMSEEYGVRSVSMDVKVGKNKEGKEAVFTTVDKIEGENLFDAKSLPAEARDKLEKLYIELGWYYGDARRQKKKFWADCKSSQFVYGHKQGEEDNDLYIVDVDPHFFEQGESEFYTIGWCLDSIAHDLVENEGRFDPPVRLEGARAELLKIIEEGLKESPDSKPLLESKDLLLKS